jgi:hypothetical protein
MPMAISSPPIEDTSGRRGMDVPLRCECGAFRGVLRSVTPRSGNRCICFCDDCQSFARFLGRADSILDAHGGTEVFQTSPARLEISEGREKLACMQLRAGSNLLRWYAGCCRTPIGNTPADARIPFVGVIHACMDLASADPVLGPVRGGFFREFARGDRSGLPPAHFVRQILRLARIVLAARLRGDQRRSPFFGPDGQPSVEPARNAS